MAGNEERCRRRHLAAGPWSEQDKAVFGDRAIDVEMLAARAAIDLEKIAGLAAYRQPMLRAIEEPAGDQLPIGASLRQRAADPVEAPIDVARCLVPVDLIGAGAQHQDGLAAIAPAKPAPLDTATAR